MIHSGEQMGGKAADCKACRGCAFAHGPAPFKNTPEKSSCMIYTDSRGLTKPGNILFDGAPCKYWRADDGWTGRRPVPLGR